ncbi:MULTISPECIES: hypothetical protein [unclassified Micromonospora]|uniref:hypothetical protein n=1 Tax=unclassified Micromonospora TaxID=2617518 RepID=UPI0033C35C63
MMTLPLLPGPPEPRTCQSCGRAVPKGPLVAGLGSGCAREHGITAPSIVRPHHNGQDGPTLLDLLNQQQRKEPAVIESPGNVVCRQRTDDEDEAVRAAQRRRGLADG